MLNKMLMSAAAVALAGAPLVAGSNASIMFRRDADRVEVAAGDAALSVLTTLEHDPTCGAQQWYSPLASADAALGVTQTQGYWGSALGTRWNQTDRKSSFVGTFVY